MPKYLLFDLDGTLTDPAKGITKSVAHALTKRGNEVDDLSALNVFIGPPLIDSFMKYYGLDEDDARRAVTDYREYFVPHGMFENAVYDGIPALLADLPDTDAPGLFDEAKRRADAAHAEGKYVLIYHWSLMYERIWKFRGMQNLLLDYFDYPDEVHALHRAVADTEKKLLLRAIAELRPDGFMFSDDLGSQRALMMSPAMFRAFIKPYYTEIWGLCRAHEVDPWLHTCGNVTEIIGDLIECGLSVLHPIQKHTMDWAETAEKWRGKIAFWVGMDVQDTLIRGTPEDVRREVRLIRDTFDSPNGGLLYASGNGIVRGTPLENIEAFLDECLRYGNG